MLNKYSIFFFAVIFSEPLNQSANQPINDIIFQISVLKGDFLNLAIIAGSVERAVRIYLTSFDPKKRQIIVVLDLSELK